MYYITGGKFGLDGREVIITDEQGAEIDSIEVIRDNDKLFIIIEDNPNPLNFSVNNVD